MARRVGPLPCRKIAKLLRDHGLAKIRQRGSHVFYEHPHGRTTIVPRHAGKDVPPGLVKKILSDARIDLEE